MRMTIVELLAVTTIAMLAMSVFWVWLFNITAITAF